MKTLLITLLLLGGTLNAQDKQFKAEYVSIREPFDSIWYSWQESTTRIVFFEYDSVISVFSSTYTEFSLLVDPIQVNEYKGHPTIRFICVDENNQQCFIDLFKEDKDTYHIYFRWFNLEIVYKVRKT